MSQQQNKSLKSSFAQHLAQTRQQVDTDTSKKAQEEILGAIEGLREFSRDFFKALDKGDSLGIDHLRAFLGYPLPTAIRSWQTKSWEEWLKEIGLLAEAQGPVGEVAREVMTVVKAFEENQAASDVLKRLLVKIVRPSQQVHTEPHLDSFLWELTQQGLATELPSSPAFKRALEWKGKWYTPTALRDSRVLWTFIVRAHGRVKRNLALQKEVLPRLQPLLEQQILDNDPELQNLHQLVEYIKEVGFMVVWDPRSRIGKEETGLLAILVGRSAPGTSLLAQGWVADKPLSFIAPEETYEFPPLMSSWSPMGDLTVTFVEEAVRNLPSEERQGIRRIQRLLNRWLGQEGRYRIPALTAAKNTSKSKTRKRNR